MGGKCCCDRKQVTLQFNDKAKDGAPAIAPASPKKEGEPRKSLAGNAYEQKKQKISIAYHSKGCDAEKFDAAFEKNDLQAFVSLLSSTQTIESFEERMHPWAEDPKTVGALAGTQLAILASLAEKDMPDMKDNIRKAGAIKPLCGFLSTDEQDRVQTSVVALSFLTADNAENAKETYEAGAMPLLMQHLDSSVAGMRAASATTLRNMCVEDDGYRKEFVKLGGIKGLVGQLAVKPDPALNLADVQLEAVLNLQDLLEREDGQLIKEYADEAIKHGVKDELKKLLKAEDEEVQSSAQEFLEHLEKHA
eukprot:TRINITY_DN31605_c0_g1_i1.p1 TRINITY_DN31605_c0_g1~~TRINITY_DN31605_c0_g1_i1.p1  ORF type:complete len:306 (+),score=101.23 TRINITY_DN31605_c0_g1_i1:76-993(+)